MLTSLAMACALSPSCNARESSISTQEGRCVELLLKKWASAIPGMAARRRRELSATRLLTLSRSRPTTRTSIWAGSPEIEDLRDHVGPPRK